MSVTLAPYRSADPLGTLQHKYVATPASGLQSLLAAMSGAAISVGAVGYGLAAGGGDLVLGLAAGYYAAPLGAVAAVALTAWRRPRSERLWLFEGGLKLEASDGTRVLLWSDVDGFQRVRTWRGVSFSPATECLCVLTTVDGEPVVLDQAFGDIEAIAARLEELTYRHIAPRMLRAFDAGTALTFGSLVLSRAGLFNGEEVIPWDAIQAVAVLDGWIHVVEAGRSKPPWLVLSVDSIPNPRVFVDLVKRGRAMALADEGDAPA